MSATLKCKLFLLILLLGFLHASIAVAKTASLSWDAVPDQDLIGYKVCYGTQSRSYSTQVDVGNVTHYDISDLQPGVTYYFAVMAYGAIKDPSTYSDELVAQVGPDDEVASLVNSDERDDQTGWWYDPQMNGTGISIEVQGQSMFLAWYFYDEQTGEPVWVSSGGTMSDPFHYSGSLLSWDGYPPNSTYGPPKAEAVGTVEVRFFSGNEAQLTWTRGPYSGSIVLSRFMDKIAAGVRENLSMHGWWYDPAYEGMGVFVEIKGGVLFTAWYNYRTDGTPRWWSSGGPFDLGTLTYQGSLEEWDGGQCPGAVKQNQEEPVSQSIGTVSLDFLTEDEAYLTWGGEELHLKRFHFGN